MYYYFIIYKPYKMLSQFVRVPKKRVLIDLNFSFPEGTNAMGRLDENTEGLLILTNNKQLTHTLLKPENKHKRIYWVQVHGKVNEQTLQRLQIGVTIILEGKNYTTLPCEARIISTPNNLAQRKHPVRDGISTTWIELVLTEGKFHQVRKMTATVGHQTMRLIRIAIEDVLLNDMKPGEVQQLSEEEIFRKLNISKV